MIEAARNTVVVMEASARLLLQVPKFGPLSQGTSSSISLFRLGFYV